jgi:uncharacterized protein (TIGR03437 family)
MSRTLLLVVALTGICAAAPDRITRPVDRGRVRTLDGGVHRLAQQQFDRGAVDPAMKLDRITLMVKLSRTQQDDLDQLLANQQNPASPLFHKWLTPEEYGSRFGLSAADHSKLVAWLTAEGFQVPESARGRNWIAFRGTAGQVARSLHTQFRRYEVNGEMRYGNATAVSIPEALADVVDGFMGLDDFKLEPQSRLVPDYNLGGNHYLVPEDFATIYNLTPLYNAGIDGTGQSIAIVGQSDILLTDIRAFRSRYNLPANDPKMLPYSSIDPGFNADAQIEGNLDVEWAGAIAPKATIYYVYGPSAISAFLATVNANLAPVISISYGGCEVDFSPTYYRAMAQQANAQGMTVLASSGDAGAMACDRQGSAYGAGGRVALFPTVLPEVTSVGGTQFVEGTGNYWGSANSANFGSAKSYIPEAVWNETSQFYGIVAGGGGVSQFYPRPSWQAGPGVPNDGFRHYPDVAFTAALHDAYFITYSGANGAVGGTSASAPAMAGVVALLNQYQMSKGMQAQPGLGNINPQLYRLAQSAPAAFHDIVDGDNKVICGQGTPDCLDGSIGYTSAAGYDMASGLGSIDVNTLFGNWNSATRSVTVNLVVSATRPALNDNVDVTALVSGLPNGTPTGSVDFSIGGVPLGSVPLVARGVQGQAADLTFPAYLSGGTGTFALTAEYSGDTAFSSGGAVRNLTIVSGSGASAIAVSASNSVWPTFPDGFGQAWQTNLTIRELGGVASIITGFYIDGTAQPLATYFPSTQIPALGTVAATVVMRNLATPLMKTFRIDGVDAAGHTWTRQARVNYLGTPNFVGFYLSAHPLVVNRNPADSSCEWPVQLTVDELDGFGTQIARLYVGGVDLTSQVPAIFGTTRLAPYGSLSGMVCFTGITPPATGYIEVDASTGFVQQILVSFAGAAANPGKMTASPALVNLSAATGSTAAPSSVAVNLSDKTQTWTASVYPANRTTAWLTLSSYSGTGSGQIALTASGAGFGPGVYRAAIVLESPGTSPQTVLVPVMFTLGGSGSGGPSITSIGNAAVAGDARVSPGMLLSIFGSKLAGTTTSASGTAIPYSLGGVTAAVNGIPAPVLYVSETQVNIQVPLEVGAGPGVLGINSNGQITGTAIQVSPAAPGIFTDASGALAPQGTVKVGATATLYLTGAGDLTLGIPTGIATSTTTPLASAPKPMLPLSLTVGGVPAFIQAVGTAPGQVGVVQVNFTVAASTPTGAQPVVVTIGGAASKPAQLTVQ